MLLLLPSVLVIDCGLSVGWQSIAVLEVLLVLLLCLDVIAQVIGVANVLLLMIDEVCVIDGVSDAELDDQDVHPNIVFQ